MRKVEWGMWNSEFGMGKVEWGMGSAECGKEKMLKA
jgi:hypothetical protein